VLLAGFQTTGKLTNFVVIAVHFLQRMQYLYWHTTVKYRVSIILLSV